MIESKVAVEKVIEENELNDVALSPLKWKQLGYIPDILKPLATTVKELEGDCYATLSQVIPAIVELTEIMKERGEISSGFGSICTEIHGELQEKFR